MSALAAMIALAEDCRSMILAVDRDSHHDWHTYRCAVHEQMCLAAARLRAAGADVRVGTGLDPSIRLCGMKATSTFGLSGALGNWLVQAHKRDEVML